MYVIVQNGFELAKKITAINLFVANKPSQLVPE